MPGCAVGEEIALIARNDCEVEGGVLLADGIDEDDVAVDARGGAVIVVLFVNRLTA